MRASHFEITGNEAAVVLFSLVFIVAFLTLLLKGKGATTFDKKMVGGFSVFLVALVANNPWVYAVSFFIGGLLIATENFLIHLAGIVWADRKDVSGITKDYHVAQQSGAEIEEKIEQEAAETLAEDPQAKAVTNAQQAKEVRQKIKMTADRVREVETVVVGYVEGHLSKVGARYVVRRHVKIEGKDYVKFFDAVVAVPGAPSINTGIEIKYFDHYSIERVKDYFTYNANAYNAYRVLFILVFGKYLSDKKKQEIIEFRKKLITNNVGVGMLVYDIGKDGALKTIDDSDLDRFFPDHRMRTLRHYEERLKELRKKTDAI